MMLIASSTTRITAAMSSMKTPTLLIRDISFTPMALTIVVKATRTMPQSTPETAKSVSPDPSPMSWKPLQICGSVVW
jgi:hypothetical protein